MSTVPTNPPANPVPGAVYVDIATNTAYVWTGTGWVPSGGSTGYNTQITTGAAILPGYFAKPDPSSYIAQVGSEPLNPSEGQIWVDDTDPTTPNPAYVWHDGAWVKLTDGTFTDTTVAAVPPASPDTGDTYFETATKRFYVWDGTAWQIIGENDDTHSIYSPSTPTLRPNGATLIAGDMWINSVSGNLSYYNGTTWVLLNTGGTSGTDYMGMIGDYEGTLPTTRPNGAAIEVGDMAVDINNSFGQPGLNVWSGASWVEPVAVSYQFTSYASEPSVGAYPAGSVYYNTSTNIPYYWDTTQWVPFTGGGSVAQATTTTLGTVYAKTESGVTNNALFGFTAAPSVSGSDNTVLGTKSGLPLSSGSENVFVGFNTGQNIETGNQNVYIGTITGYGATNSTGNTGIGYSALVGQHGNYNVAVGHLSGSQLGPGANNNVILGSFQGNSLTSDNLVLAKGGLKENIAFQINETNAFGVPSWSTLAELNTTTVNYGTAGQVLTSQGMSAPPQWTTVSSGGASATPLIEGIVLADTPVASDTALGWNTELAGDSNNTYVGSQAGTNNTATKDANTHVGSSAGKGLSGSQNTTLGASTGANAGAGSRNTLLGSEAGFGLSGDANVIIGVNGGSLTAGNQNVLIGTNVGNVSGDGNLVLGSYTASINNNNQAVIAYGDDNNGISAGADRILLTGNENGAWGLWNGATPISSSTHSNYGTAGQVLVSQGTTAPPQWATISGSGALSATPSVEGVVYGFTAAGSSGTTTLGASAGNNGTAGEGSVYIGNEAGKLFNGGSDYNVVIGARSATSIINGQNNTIIGGQSLSDPSVTTPLFNVTSIGGWTGNNALVGGEVILSNGAGNIRLYANADGAWATNGTQTDFGASGQVLTSQGSAAAPEWTTVPTARTVSFAGPSGFVNINFVTTVDRVILPIAGDLAIPIIPPTNTIPDGAYIKIIAQQNTSPIVLSNDSGGTINFMGGGTSYSWTPTFIGQTATITYYAGLVADGFGYLVELSSN